MTLEEIAMKVRRSVAFVLNLELPRDDEEIKEFDAIKLKTRPLRDQEADAIATSIRRKMREENPKFALAASEVKDSAIVGALIGVVTERMA